jgi:hypothetical protein
LNDLIEFSAVTVNAVRWARHGEVEDPKKSAAARSGNCSELGDVSPLWVAIVAGISIAAIMAWVIEAIGVAVVAP